MRGRAQLVSLVASLGVLLAAVQPAAAVDVTATPGNTFDPATVTVVQGEDVRWANAGGFHNVHFDDESFIQPPNVALPPWTVSRTFIEPGSFTYYCDAHAFVGMTGTVNVLPVQGSASDPAAGAAPVSGQAATPVCTRKRRFKIRLRGLARVRVRTAGATFNGKELPVRTEVIDGRRRHTADVDMRGLPRGTYTVAISVRTADGRLLRGVRTYRTCAGKLQSAKLPEL